MQTVQRVQMDMFSMATRATHSQQTVHMDRRIGNVYNIDSIPRNACGTSGDILYGIQCV